MENSNVYKLVRTFTAMEVREVQRFLASPYFNLRPDVVALFESLHQTEVPDKRAVWAAVYGDKPFDDTQLRLLMSYLNQLLETFLLVQDTRAQLSQRKLRLATAYRNRGLMGQYERNIRGFEKELAAQPLRNAFYYGLLREYAFEIYETTIAQKPSDTESLASLTHSTDVYYLSDRLRLVCLELSQKNVYRSGEVASAHQYILALAEQKQWCELPGISTYLAASKMLLYPAENAYYQSFKEKLAEAKAVFSEAEIRECYAFSVNHCIKRANEGEKAYEKELFDLYRLMLDAGYLFEYGVLSRFTYHNIVGAGLRCGELAWVDDFIHRYQPMLEKQYRDSSFHFNLARLHYERKRFDSVLVLMQKANYSDPLLNLAAKTLLLKTYFELREYDLLLSHLDAMRNYIRRNKVIGYHRTNYLNIIRYTERLLHVGHHDKAASAQLRHDLEREPVLTERSWFLSFEF
jgi:hypothetical protein